MILPYNHNHAAHCESGVMSSLLKHRGFDVSEPLVFGISSVLFFAYIPILKFGNLPLIAYRSYPGAIIKNFPKKTGMEHFKKQYSDTEKGREQAMEDLIKTIDSGQPAGLITSPYFIPYFPPEMRFQFNAHNIIVYGYEGEQFYVSDPVFSYPVKISYADLKKARFPKGLAAPKGFMHFPLKIPNFIDFHKIIFEAIKKVCFNMLKIPFPFFGVRAIFYLSKTISKLPQHNNLYARHFLGNIVRMQEEIGTGGAGFRFIYSAFLQEASEMLGLPFLKEASLELTRAGDSWREFALLCAKEVKSRNPVLQLNEITTKLEECGRLEKTFFEGLYNNIVGKK